MAGPVLFRPGNITSGLVGYWKLDEASGSRADSSGNGNTLTDNNTVTSVAQDYWKTGENSADFERGNSEYLSIADGSQTGLDLTDTLTMACWIKLESSGATCYIMGKGYSANGWLMRLDTSDKVRVTISQTDSVTSATAISVGKWTHVAVTHSDTLGVSAIYLNGNLDAIASHANVIADNTKFFAIGASDGDLSYFDGLVKDAAVWSAVLTPIQIKSLALGVDLSTFAYRPNNVSTQPTAWWKLNELSGNRSDSIGSATLTDVNTVLSGGGYIEGVGADFENGSTEYFTAADSANWYFTADFGISLWVKPESFAIENGIIGQDDGSVNNRWTLRVSVGSTSNLEFYCGSTQIFDTAHGMSAATWHHIFLKRSGTTWSLFIDGVSKYSGTNAASFPDASGLLNIGRCPRATNKYWDGLMTDVAIWKGYAPTDAEIKSLACGIPLQQTGIVSYWKLDETSGSRADSIGSNTLTDNNTVLSGTGKVSNAADFESSTSESLSITNGSQVGLDITSDMSFIMWLNPESLPNDTSIAGRGWSTPGYYFFKASGGIGFNGSSDPTGASTGTWRHYAGTVDGAAIKLFANSTLVTNTASTTLPTSNTETFSLGYIAALNYYDGLMDEVVLAKRWFRDEEIKTIYCKGLAGKELTNSERSLGAGAFFLVF